jgi:hypothetical protein
MDEIEYGPKSRIVWNTGVRWDTASTGDDSIAQNYVNEFGKNTLRNKRLEYIARLTWMTPEEFKERQMAMFRMRKKFPGQTAYDLYYNILDQERVNQLRDDMRRGDTFSALVLYYDSSGKLRDIQEGRHRVEALIKYNVKKIPVWEIYERVVVGGGLTENSFGPLEYDLTPEAKLAMEQRKSYDIGDKPRKKKFTKVKIKRKPIKKVVKKVIKKCKCKK